MSNTKNTITRINSMGEQQCFELFKPLTNSSLCHPILLKSIQSRPYLNFIGMRNSFYKFFDQSSFVDTLEILRSHDVLGATPIELTDNALQEQIKSGLQKLSSHNQLRLKSLNIAYKAKFSFNFICVTKSLTTDEIFYRFEKRLSNDFESEYLFSIIQLKKLLHLRLLDIIDENDFTKEPSFFMENMNEYVQKNNIIPIV